MQGGNATESLRDKVVIVTGAGSGIGYETALAFAREGAKLVLADRRGERLPELAGRIEALGGEALVVATDVSRRDQVDAMAQASTKKGEARRALWEEYKPWVTFR